MLLLISLTSLQAVRSLVDSDSLECMATAIYWESKSESTAGQIAVGQTILNRTQHPRFPGSVCGVVKEGRHIQGLPVKDRCQFSFYCDGRSDVPREPKAYEKALRLSEWLLLTKDWIPDLTDGALYYHASWMEIWPKWSQEKRRLLQIDSHVFYQ